MDFIIMSWPFLARNVVFVVEKRSFNVTSTKFAKLDFPLKQKS
jgi:hypothetical protein